MKIVLVVGARPNFMKVAPIAAALRRHPERHAPVVVHTGQHYDYRMSEIFFRDLELAPPDHYLEARTDGPAPQMGDIMAKFDAVLAAEAPDLVVVVGDVSSTVACALAAAARQVPVAHVEAGLRSGDRRMPEEINRVATDAIADMLFTHCADADANLAAEAVPARCIFRVGNLMIDTLVRCRHRAAGSAVLADWGLEERGYVLVTLHRPANVDDPGTLAGILGAFERIQACLPVVFLAHPRTARNLERFGLLDRVRSMPRLQLREPVGYVDMLRLQEAARLVLVDSGGIQEETTALGVPCLTMRDNTERPITVTEGTNTLVGADPERIAAAALRAIEGGGKRGRVPELWDGHSAERLVAVLDRGAVRR
ncbi:MAG: UDP-N-acetylglucosamine 2-epimerase (non-hydrolyzing) [Gemmatimonadota bacterium]